MQAIILVAGVSRRFWGHCSLRLVLATFLSFVSGICFSYDFASTCATGQTLYYNIIDSVDNKVCVTYPGPDIDHAFLNYAQPIGDLVIPHEVSQNGQIYLVTEIESCAFAKCIGLNGVLEVPYSITRIGSYAFLHCANISVLVFNCQRCSEAFAAFEGCSFDTILLGDSVTVLPNGIFSNSLGITSLQIPASVRAIGERAFYNCPNLEKIDFCDSVITIGDFAFSDCYSLVTLNVIDADGIGDYAFWGCQGLRNFTLGSKAQKIGNYAFYRADHLDTVFCWAAPPPLLGEDSFSQLSQGSCLIVCCDVVDEYQSAQGWDVFSNIAADQTFIVEAVANQADYGNVSGSGEGFCYDDTVSVEAFPFDGFYFKEWSDGDINNPRDIVVQSDTLVIAIFDSDPSLGFDDICGGELNVVMKGRTIFVSASCPTIFLVYDVEGRCLYRSKIKEDRFGLLIPNSGLYFVATDDNQIIKIAVVR